MRKLVVRLGLGLVVVVASLSSVVAVAATTGPAPEIPVSYFNSQAGRSTPLRAKVAYQASTFPLALRLTPPDGSWSGAQWKTGKGSCGGGTGRRPPYFGWVAVDQGSGSALPRGVIEIMTAYARTPLVATTLNALRTRGRGATYQATSQVKLAGFSGSQFDGQVVGRNHLFFPFTPVTHAAVCHPDAQEFSQGEAFRIIVLNVRGKTVVVELDSAALPPEQFPAFLAKADRILKSLRFPRRR